MRPTQPRARPSESSPSGQRACLLPWEQGWVGGDMEGQVTTLFIFVIPPTSLAPRGCLFMGHICWLAGDTSLVRMPEVPKEPGKWDTFLRTRLFSLLTESCDSGSPPVILALPTAQPPALYLFPELPTWRCWALSAFSGSQCLSEGASSLSALCPSGASTQITLPRC